MRVCRGSTSLYSYYFPGTRLVQIQTNLMPSRVASQAIEANTHTGSRIALGSPTGS